MTQHQTPVTKRNLGLSHRQKKKSQDQYHPGNETENKSFNYSDSGNRIERLERERKAEKNMTESNK